MTLRQIVTSLRSKGVRIEYRKRRDGSIEIKSINGSKYSRREGNVIARAMAGEPLSARKQAQRVAASKRENFYKPKKESHRKGVRGLNKAQKRFIANYNRKVDWVNAKYNPKKALTKIGAKQARQAMSRGVSWDAWKKTAKNQAIARAIDLPLGAGGIAERYALALYIRTFYKTNKKAMAVANYINTHRVSQSYLEKLHDLAYRHDTTSLNWDNALPKAKESNKKINDEIKQIRQTFASL